MQCFRKLPVTDVFLPWKKENVTSFPQSTWLAWENLLLPRGCDQLRSYRFRGSQPSSHARHFPLHHSTTFMGVLAGQNMCSHFNLSGSVFHVSYPDLQGIITSVLPQCSEVMSDQMSQDSKIFLRSHVFSPSLSLDSSVSYLLSSPQFITNSLTISEHLVSPKSMFFVGRMFNLSLPKVVLKDCACSQMSCWALGPCILSAYMFGWFLSEIPSSCWKKYHSSEFRLIFNKKSFILIVALTEMDFANPHLSRAASQSRGEKLHEKASILQRWPFHFEILNRSRFPSLSGFY